MNFHIITLFPQSLDSYLKESILKHAQEDGKIKINFYNPRDYVSTTLARKEKRELTYSEKRVDNKPYGGGPGMVIEALPVIKAIEVAMKKCKKPKIIWLSPAGKQLTTNLAKVFAQKNSDIIIICGRYEGIDARVKSVFKVEEVSVGPYVLTGGELAAMILIDTISRQVEGVLGNFNSLEESRISSSDTYTRPEVFIYKKKKYKVPKVLLSGNHKDIEEWKMRKK
jgi:tRNA (guanine37-N1)-methyltransferase